MRNAGRDIAGRDSTVAYYQLLEMLEARFPFGNDLHVPFPWSVSSTGTPSRVSRSRLMLSSRMRGRRPRADAFNGESTSVASLNFERAAVICNLGALLSQMAAMQSQCVSPLTPRPPLFPGPRPP